MVDALFFFAIMTSKWALLVAVAPVDLYYTSIWIYCVNYRWNLPFFIYHNISLMYVYTIHGDGAMVADNILE